MRSEAETDEYDRRRNTALRILAEYKQEHGEISAEEKQAAAAVWARAAQRHAASPRGTSIGGSLVLAHQGLLLYRERDRHVMSLIEASLRRGTQVVVSGATLVTAQREGVTSELKVEPVCVAWSMEAVLLLQEAGRHGHTHAIDALVAVTARHQPRPVAMITSDVNDMARLCGPNVELFAV